MSVKVGIYAHILQASVAKETPYDGIDDGRFPRKADRGVHISEGTVREVQRDTFRNTFVVLFPKEVNTFYSKEVRPKATDFGGLFGCKLRITLVP